MFYTFRHIFIMPVFILVFLVLQTGASHACSCRHSGEPEVAYKGTKYIFTAKITGVTKDENDLKTYHFTTDRVFKGNIDRTFSKSQKRHHSMCHFYQFDAQATYLIYSNQKTDDTSYAISQCSRTKKIEDAEIELRYLSFFKNNKDRTALDMKLPEFAAKNQNSKRIQEALKLIAHNEYLPLDKDQKFALLEQHMHTKDTAIQKSVLTALSQFQLYGHAGAVDIAAYYLLNASDINIKRNAAYTMTSLSSNTAVFDVLRSVYHKGHTVMAPDLSADEYAYHTELIAGMLSSAQKAEDKKSALDIARNFIKNNPAETPVNIIQRIGFMGADAASARPEIKQLLTVSAQENLKHDYRKLQQLQYTIITLGMIGNTSDVPFLTPYLHHKKCRVMVETANALDTLQAHKMVKTTAFPIFKERFDTCKSEIISSLQKMTVSIDDMMPFLKKQVANNTLQLWHISQIQNLLTAYEQKQQQQ